jgi:hypothetical protein
METSAEEGGMTTLCDYASLDPGIVSTVRLLHQHGVVTTDSGDGVSKPAEARTFGDMPHVVCRTTPEAMVYDAHAVADILGDAWTVEASYGVGDGVALVIATANHLSNP